MLIRPVSLGLGLGCLRGVRVGLDAYMLDDLLFLGSEDFGEVFVELGLVLLEFCGQEALEFGALHPLGGFKEKELRTQEAALE